MFTSGNTSPCHHSLHLFVKTDESQQTGIVQKLSDRALRRSRTSCCRGHVRSYAFPPTGYWRHGGG
ncbi:hypothetical protein CFR80_11705 [Komagataeibacter oboediens]|uniref:Uncharacterized protein n=1 Tax=Komagataeibacter oboediens TaxID=65958 RepID=A0A318QPI6_9PROT|nr:hypothetical protein CFR80_11705 [Komagataeibacter oboediens]